MKKCKRSGVSEMAQQALLDMQPSLVSRTNIKIEEEKQLHKGVLRHPHACVAGRPIMCTCLIIIN